MQWGGTGGGCSEVHPASADMLARAGIKPWTRAGNRAGTRWIGRAWTGNIYVT